MASGDDELVERQTSLEEAQRDLSALADQAITDSWPPDERAALADARDAVADEVDEAAATFDDRARRRDEDAMSRQVATTLRRDRDLGEQSASDDAAYDRYMGARDREGTAADRAGAAADRVRSATRRHNARDARRRSAADRDEAAAARASLEGISGDTAHPED